MPRSSYLVKEVFRTVQGEGLNAGRPAIFVRLASCNMWDGHPDHREEWFERTGAFCAMFCDTAFHPTDADGGPAARKLSAADLVGAVVEAQGGHPVDLVVLTGGEPLLQADASLFLAFRAAGFSVAVETNGTRSLVEALWGDEFRATKKNVEAHDGHYSSHPTWVRERARDLQRHFESVVAGRGAREASAPDYVTVSPKLPDHATRIEALTELKCVVPSYVPKDYPTLEDRAVRTSTGPLVWVQPEDGPRYAEAARMAVDYATLNGARVSVQGHKVLDVP